MNLAIATTQLINLLAIGSLPLVFFKRDGRLNLLWWLTALPFFAATGLVLSAMLGLIQPLVGPQSLHGSALGLMGLLLSLGSIALIAYTVGTHNRPLALWHQGGDTPEHIVTHGAYRYVRHPFYSAFLLGLLGVALHVPHAATLMVFAYALGILRWTAVKEEGRLLKSSFGDAYGDYLAHTGRFVPKGGRRHA